MDKQQIYNILQSDILSFSSCQEIFVPDSLKKWSLVFCFKGVVKIGNMDATLLIGFQKYFPYTKPLYFLEKWNIFGFIPHVDPDGYICYTQEDNLVLDAENPSGILNSTLELAINTVKNGKEGLNFDDFLNEFESYWNHHKTRRNLLSACSLKDEVTKIRIGIRDQLKVIGDNDEQLAELIFRLTRKKITRFDNAIYIPLKQGLVKHPPSYDKFWSHEDILDLVYASISKEKLKVLLGTKMSKDEYVALAVPKKNNQKTLICVVYRTKNENIHPLLSHGSDFVPEPVFLQNIGQDVIVPRGGGNYDLINKKILIAGCGSLGSQIACDSAKTGIGYIDICDFDNFKYENIYRHVLGKESIGLNKALALKSLIEKQMPFTNVNALPNKIEDQISHEYFESNKYDVLILATGFPTTNLFINRIIKTKFPQLPVIFAWIEPYGIGGHALLSSKNEDGCYNCLYDNNLHNKASFAGSDQPGSFSKKIAGCGSLYVPFSYLDATKTSNLAVRLLVSFLTGSEKGNPLLSWKGNSETFEKEGFHLSTRYKEQTEEIMNEKRYNYINKICQICGKK